MRVRMGMGRCFQITNIFPNLTALENVRLAVQAKAEVYYNIISHYKKFKEIEEKAMEYLQKVKLAESAFILAKNLAHGDKRKLEIAIALALEPEILLLDEPTAGMSRRSTRLFWSCWLILKLKENRRFYWLNIKWTWYFLIR